MATKKTAAKAASKKPVAKKATTKKPAAKKAVTKRPDSNQPPSKAMIDSMTGDILHMIEELDNFAANLRALGRQRHNGVGLKRLGFIEAACRISSKFPQYFPHWLNTAKFKRDLDLFTAVRSLLDATRSLEEKAWNINIEGSDMTYTNALEYYSQVQDAARRRIDSAETIYAELNSFFRHGSRSTEEPTEKKIKRDVNALLHGRKDGEVIVKNIKPKTTGGKHEVIDETFKDSASFKESEEGEIRD
jgi:hypothetical protein